MIYAGAFGSLLVKKVLSGRYLALVGCCCAVIIDYDMRCFWCGARAKGVFIGVSSNSPKCVGGALQEKTAIYHVFCLHLVRHVPSKCCILCFVLSSWSHIDVCGVVKLCAVISACVGGAP